MKKKLILASAISATLVTGCSKEHEFKTAINNSISSHYECLNLNIYSSAPYGFADDKFKEYKDKNTYVTIAKTMKNGQEQKNYSAEQDQQRDEKLNSLIKAGLLTKSEITVPSSAKDLFGKPITNLSFVVDLYNLTDAGKQTQKSWPTSAMARAIQGDSAGNGIFCYAHPQVDSIINFREGDFGGQNVAEVKYSYKYVDITDWINKPEIKTSFPEIDKNLNNPDKTSTTTLSKTNNGWQDSL